MEDNFIEKTKEIKKKWLESLTEEEKGALRNVELGIGISALPVGLVTAPLSPPLAVALSFIMNAPILYEFGRDFVQVVKEDIHHVKSAVDKLKKVI